MREQARFCQPLSGACRFYDPVKQLRLEVRRGIEQFSTLRRSLGGSHSDMLKSSPAHMLYAARSLPKIALPPRCLIVHGGEDESVPLTQSVLLKSVLTGAGAGESCSTTAFAGI